MVHAPAGSPGGYASSNRHAICKCGPLLNVQYNTIQYNGSARAFPTLPLLALRHAPRAAGLRTPDSRPRYAGAARRGLRCLRRGRSSVSQCR